MYQPFSIYMIYLFYALQISVKLGLKLGQKLTTFSYFMSSCTNRIEVFKKILYWYVANQEANKTVPAIFFFSNIFWIIYF